MKFKEITPGMVIHCPKEEDARVLMEHLNELGYAWKSEDPLTEKRNYDYKIYTCYHLFRDMTVLRGKIGDYANDGSVTITEFSDLIEPESLSGKEVIEWFDKYSREIESMPELFPNCKTITDVIELYTPECIMEKMVWYEKHKKIESENLTGGEKSTDSPINPDTDSPMTAAEVLEWLIRHDSEKEIAEIFDADAVCFSDFFCRGIPAKEILDKITAYEAAKKAPKPVEVEWVDICRIYDKDSGVYITEYEFKENEKILKTEEALRSYAEGRNGEYYAVIERRCQVKEDK